MGEAGPGSAELGMDAEPQISRSGARHEYAGRLRAHEAQKSSEERVERRLGYVKVAIAALTVFLVFWLLHQPRLLGLLLLPVALFVLLEVWHGKLIERVRFRVRSIEFYRRGIARTENRWAGCGEGGERFLEPKHPYARDLDLFGEGSLFQLLNMARTVAGEETLAAWLLAAAPREEISARQEAVRELTPRVDFRENIFLLGETLRAAVDPEKLASWGERAPVLGSEVRRVLSSAFLVLWIGSLAAWGLWGLGWCAALTTLLNLGWSRHLSSALNEAAGAIEDATEDLIVLSGVLALVEREPFVSTRLSGLQAALRTDDIPPSRAIRTLARIVEYLNQRHNLFLRPLDRVTFWSAQLAFAAEAWQQKYGRRIRGWLKAVGEVEALNALAAFAFENPGDAFPEIVDLASSPGQALFAAEDLAHPLLPATAVRNSFQLGDELQVVILSGPNMAGKSTFIRAVGLNAVLAQCGAPVRATRLRLSRLTVAASICVLDSLSGGVSRFYAEIGRIKCIVELSRAEIPVLFLLDELLSGTNSADRLAGSEFIVRSLAERNAIGIVSTHDLALTRIPGVLGRSAANYHFDDRLEKDALAFDYKLKSGVVTSSNALKLMRAIGLEIAD